jgi:hypothetical protein
MRDIVMLCYAMRTYLENCKAKIGMKIWKIFTRQQNSKRDAVE